MRVPNNFLTNSDIRNKWSANNELRLVNMVLINAVQGGSDDAVYFENGEIVVTFWEI